MSIRFHCPNCDKKLKAAEDHIGRKVKCKQCGQIVRVPPISEPTRPSRSPMEPPAGALGGDVDGDTEDGPLLAPLPVIDHEETIDMTAMVDVTFFLLIFFMVTSMHHKQAAISMPSPDVKQQASKSRAVAASQDDADMITVRIDADDSFWIEDDQYRSPQDMADQLKKRREGANAPTKLMVVASGDAHHGAVVAALDAGAAAGMEGIRLSTEREP